jgi:hypothetical protein
LRPSYLGRTLNAYESFADHAILRIGAYTGDDGVQASVLGLFNTSEAPTTFLVSILEFPLLNSNLDDEYLICAHFAGDIFLPVAAGDSPASIVHGRIAVCGYEILCAYKIHHVETSLGSLSLAVLGLLGKMTGAAAVVKCKIIEWLNKISVKT